MPTSIKIDRECVYDMYMTWVDKVSEECDWKSSFGPEEIVNQICGIIEANPQVYSFQVKL